MEKMCAKCGLHGFSVANQIRRPPFEVTETQDYGLSPQCTSIVEAYMISREFEILNNLDIARAHATLFIEERPDYAAATQKLIQEIQRIRVEFVSTVRAEEP